MGLQTQDVGALRGETLTDREGNKIGTIEEIYLDLQSGEPEWIAVRTGMLGTKVNFVPIRDASRGADGVQVPYGKDQVKDAPNVEADGELSPEEEHRLYEHYSLEWGDFDDGREADSGREARYARDVDAGRDTETGRATDDAMTRSEEELQVGKARRETGRARLRKYVVTEEVQTTVPVQREEVRLEREPVTDENVDRALSGPDITESEHEVTLHAEEPVVEKRTVPKERVRLEKDTVTEQEQVSDEVRKERIETEGDVR